jgi:site-specific DNA-cytosine methylase
MTPTTSGGAPGQSGAMNVLSMYAGIGGFDLAAHAAGMRTVAFCEPEPFCRRVLAHHWPGVPCYAYDHDITAARLRADGIGPIDLIIGGPPCQPASAAGKRLGASDSRWRWPEFLRIVGDLRPRWVVAENPTGLLSLFDGAAFHAILLELSALGYRTGHCVYGADAVGAPHRRDRVFITGYLAHAASLQLRREPPAGADEPGHSGAGAVPGRGPLLAHADKPECQARASNGMGVGQQASTSPCAGLLALPARDGRGERRAESAGQQGRPDAALGGATLADAGISRFDGRQDTQGHRANRQDAGRQQSDIEPQQRDSDVADAGSDGREEQQQPVHCGEALAAVGQPGSTGLAHAERQQGGQRYEPAMLRGRTRKAQQTGMASGNRAGTGGGQSIPYVGFATDGPPGGLSGDWPARPGTAQAEWEAPRTCAKGTVSERVSKLKALGNSVVWQQAYPIFRAIAECEATA